MVLGTGSFARSTAQILADAGARVATYLNRPRGRHAPTLSGPVFAAEAEPDLVALLRRWGADWVFPQSIDWARQPWAAALRRARIPVLCPTGEGLRLERERDFARRLCAEHGIPFPAAHVAANRPAALAWLDAHPRPCVIKNPLCGPGSPVHTIVCETVADTRAWLDHVNYAEGIFLQEYLGRAEAGHLALVQGGDIVSLATNQEYKRSHAGEMGVVCGAPLGGVVERDPEDRHGLARALLHPLRPWFRRVRFRGPVQVTACRVRGRWHVLEYNVRLGITSGSMILRLLANPLEALTDLVHGRTPELRWRSGRRYGCSITLAAHGYPHRPARQPALPVIAEGNFDCDVWWNDVAPDRQGRLVTAGQRIADVAAYGPTLAAARERALKNIRQIRVLGGFYRPDIGAVLWPPGAV